MAVDNLREKGLAEAAKRMSREAEEGKIVSYIHAEGRIGVLVEVNCETDFVARTQEFKDLAHMLAMQITAMAPTCITEDELPKDDDVEPQNACLMLQPYIKDPSLSIKDLIMETIAKVGENIRIARFTRYELGA